MKSNIPTIIGSSARRITLTSAVAAVLLAQTVGQAETPARRMGGIIPSTASKPPISAPQPSSASDGPVAWWEDSDSMAQSGVDAKDMLPKRWNLFGSLTAGYEYDDNLSLDEDGKAGSGFMTVQPSVGAKYGPMASGLTMDLIYTADLEWYLDNDMGDRVNHDVSTNFNWERGPFRLFGSLAYSSQASANIDAGERIAQDTITTNMGATYEHSEKTSLGVTYSTDVFSPEDDSYIPSTTQTFGVFADYKVSGKTTLGLGAQYEYQQVGRGSDSNAYRVLLRSTWAATDRLTLRGEVGPEVREYTDADSGMEAYWNLGIDYKLKFLDTGKTTFSFDVYRDQSASSSLVNQSYTSTGIAGTLSYTPAERISVNIATGYEFANYTGTSAEVNADRQDQLYFARPSISYSFSRRASMSLFYQWTQNVSEGDQGVGFERNGYGALFTVSF